MLLRNSKKAARTGAETPTGAPASRKKRLLFAGLYVLFLLLVVEGAARLTWRMVDKTWGLLVPQEIGQFDDELGWSLAPGAKAVSKSTGRLVTYAINSKGLRNEEVPYEKPEGTFRIVVLGDSHAFGFGVPLEMHFTKLLEGYFDGVQVINMGVNGYGVDQELLLLRKEGFKYRPDLVLVYVPHYADARHIRDKVWNMGKPMFELEDGKLRLTNSPVSNNSFLYALGIGADRLVSSVSRAYQMLRDAVLHFVMDRRVKKRLPPKELMDKMNSRGEAIVFAMADEAKARGAKFAVVTRVGELAIAAFNKAIPELYIAPALMNHGMAIADDPTRHPNEAANGIIAWEVAKFLKEQKLVPEQYEPKLPTFDQDEDDSDKKGS